MSEYVFPKSFLYTEGSGSGSGSGGTRPCDPCPFPPGTNIQTHYQDLTAQVASDASGEEACCPTLPRTKNCFNCGFAFAPPGVNSETHYVDTNVKVPIDEAGIDECCPLVPKPENPQLYPCVNCGLGGNSIDDFYIDITAQVSTEGGCCPVVPRDDNECDPACGECEDCINGTCVERQLYPCSACEYENGSIFPPGTSVDTHYIDVSIKNCTPNGCCPAVERDLENPDHETITIDVPAGQIKTAMPKPNLTKTGPGTLVLIPPPTSTPPVFPPICKLLNIQEGKCVLGPGVEQSFTATDTKIKLGKVFTCGFGITGNARINVNSIDFGSDTGFGPVSYTTLNYNSTSFNGYINVGSGGITIAQNGIGSANIRDLLISGRNDGSWNGSVGFTTDVDVNGIKNIGYIFNDDGSTTVAWAAPGDTNLDGVIDILDVANILSSNKYDSGESAHWFEGDFNYDGIVDSLDIASFLANDLLDKGNYLPQDTSFTVKWTLASIRTCDFSTLSNVAITVSTKDVLKPGDPVVRAMTPPFISPATNKKSVVGCEILTKLECNKKAQSVFVPGGNCNDASCKPHNIPTPKTGACCVRNNNPLYVGAPITYSCEMVSDTPLSSAESYCSKVLRGTFKGYNTVCTDQTCPSTKIITIPTTPPTTTPGKATWGGCCIPTNFGLGGKCVILNNEPTQVSTGPDGTSVGFGRDAFTQCSALGGMFYGYGETCFDTCQEAKWASPN